MANKRIRKKQWKQAGGVLTCTLCGKELWPEQKNYIVGHRGAVCHRCLSVSRLMAVCQQEDSCAEGKPLPVSPAVFTPQELTARLDRVIAGQEEAKRAVALAMWKQRLRAGGEGSVPASHLFLYGPTGCGKTYLARRASELAGLPSVIFDATTLSEAGYRGRDALDILKDYALSAEDHAMKAHGVIILDEADKLAARGSPERQAYCRGTQHSLLKLLEGVEHNDLDSSGLLFVLCGAFPGLGKAELRSNPIGFLREKEEKSDTGILPEDFVSFGMERELMGRIPNLAAIHPLTEEDLIRILLEKDDSAFKVYQRFFASRGLKLTLPREEAGVIAGRALALGTGARGLKAELDKVMEPLMLQLAAGELKGEVILHGAELSNLSEAAESRTGTASQ